MYIKQKIDAVSRIFRQADNHVAAFQSQSNLSCVPQCGLCCTKSTIQTTVLEFYPAAYELFLCEQSDIILENIEKKNDNICVFYNPFSTEGFCRYYQNRGLLCRLFGFSRKNGKTGAYTFVTCNPINQKSNVYEIQDKLIYAPDISDYYVKLFGIDPNLSVQYLPVNQAIKKAIETVLLHFQYRKKPA